MQILINYKDVQGFVGDIIQSSYYTFAITHRESTSWFSFYLSGNSSIYHSTSSSPLPFWFCCCHKSTFYPLFFSRWIIFWEILPSAMASTNTNDKWLTSMSPIRISLLSFRPINPTTSWALHLKLPEGL